jgi:hypothetical protein
MRAFEDKAQKAVEVPGNVVEYVDVAVYATPRSTIPIGFLLSYIAQNRVSGTSITDSTYVPNDNQGLLPNLGN